MHCSEQEVLICQHVFEGSHPDVVVRAANESAVAVCSSCFGVAEDLTPACPHDGIPNRKLWEQLPEENGVFRFLDDQWVKEA
jgi:hypothetical protein